MGKFTKKIVAIFVTLTMVLSSAAFAFAADSPGHGADDGDKAGVAKVTKQNSTMDYTKKTMRVTYKANKNAVKFKVAYRTQGGKWKYVTTKNKNYTLKNLKDKGLYEVKVAGINKDGKVGKYTTLYRRYMRKSSFTAKASKGSVKITTKKISGVSGYQIRYSTKSNMSGYKTVTVKTTKALSKTLKLKKGTYYIQVRPFKTVNGKRYVGTYTTKRKVTVK
jgi:hypothetical protein